MSRWGRRSLAVALALGFGGVVASRPSRAAVAPGSDRDADRGPTDPLPPPGDSGRVPDPDPDPIPEPDPEPDPKPEPVPKPDPGQGRGRVEPDPLPDPLPDPAAQADEPRRWGAAPFGDLTTGSTATDIQLGGDLVIPPRCKDDGVACHGGRLGFRARFPVTTGSATGAGRATADALQGFSKSWRVGLVVDYLRDTTGTEGPAKLLLLTFAGEWGVGSFHYVPNAGPDDRRETKHSADVMARGLLYRHHPRRYRIAPQVILRYRRDWAGATPVGVVQAATAELPEITRDVTIDGPHANPVFAVTVPVLYSIQKGKRILPQLGFGPAVSYAARGKRQGYNPFNEELLVRLEHWLYWYPTGNEGLEGPKTNVRIGVTPFLDIRMRGRAAADTTTDVGALVEVKVGVRGYEY